MKKSAKLPGPAPANLITDPHLLAQMLDAITAPVFAKDKQHRWTYLNKALCDFMGHDMDELIGKSDYDFFPKEQADVFWKLDDQAFKTRGDNINEEFFTDASGVKHTIVTRKKVFKNANGDDVLIGIINDITEIRKANEGLLLFRTLLERSSDAIFVVSPEDGSILDVNETACRSLGYTRKTLLRMTANDIIAPPLDPDEWRHLLKDATNYGTLLVERSHRRSDGTTFPVESSVKSIDIDNKRYLLANVRDISERKKMEETVKEVKALRGLIPICAKCKKIRDDKGFWEKVEIYLEKHSDARFTHGLCKDCMEELYGKETWFKEGKEKEGEE